MKEKETSRCNSAPNVYERFLLIKEPHFFVLALMIWLLLILYALKRQTNFLMRRRQIVNVKKLQLEIRKKLKREQLTFDMAREILQASMAQTERTCVKKLAHLADLHTLLQDISSNLEKLEIVLTYNYSFNSKVNNQKN